jgi:hypothetical protein
MRSPRVQRAVPSLQRLSLRLSTLFATLVSVSLTPIQTWAQPSSGVEVASATASSPAAPTRTSTLNGEVQNLVLKGDSLEIVYKNTGSSPTAIIGELQVHVTEEEVVSSVVFANAMIVKPGATQRYRVAMPKLAKGRYTLVAIVDYGGQDMTAAMATLDMR